MLYVAPVYVAPVCVAPVCVAPVYVARFPLQHLRVSNVSKPWANHTAFVFDDSFEHSVSVAYPIESALSRLLSSVTTLSSMIRTRAFPLLPIRVWLHSLEFDCPQSTAPYNAAAPHRALGPFPLSMLGCHGAHERLAAWSVACWAFAAVYSSRRDVHRR